jgi:putative nucleotidyltransferase with HDIG domain
MGEIADYFLQTSPQETREEEMPELLVSVDHLRVGVFIHLDLKWYEHPFLTNNFKIKNVGQIQTLKELGLSHVLFDPVKSDQQPAPPPGSIAQSRSAQIQQAPAINHLWEIKQQRIKQLQERNRRIQQCDRQYTRTFGQVKKMMDDLMTGSEEAIDNANVLIQDMVGSLLSEREVMVHLMNVKGKEEGVYYHTLNVAILALLLAKEYGIKSDSMEILGLGALFHDIGKQRIPKKILLKRSPLTLPEREIVRMHPKYGEQMALRMGSFPTESAVIIRQHHETNDGAGYPDGLPSDKISILSKILSVANVYDNHCNHWNPDESMTPHEAMSQMFCLLNSKFDPELLSLFIHCMGVYPPGTVVQLSNDFIGMVVSASSENQLRPCVLVHDAQIPAKEALILDLNEDPEIAILKSLRPSQLSPEVYAYLNPRSLVTYFLDTNETNPLSPLASSK